MIRRVVFQFCIVAFVLVGLAPLRGSAQSELTTLRLIASPVDDVMPVLYAQRAGLFRQAGLNVVIDRAQGGGVVAAAVEGHAVDLGKVNIGAIIAAHAHGLKLTIVAPAAVYDPNTPDAILAVAANGPIRSANDLAGKTVGVPSLNEINVWATRAWLDANHVDWKSAQFIEIPFSSMVAAVEQDRVQAVTLVKPFTIEAVRSGRARMLGLYFSAIAPRFLESVWVADTDFVTAHKAEVQKFQRVVAQASAYTNAHPSETVDLLASWTGITPEQAARAPRIVTGIVPRVQEIQPVINAAAKYGDLIAKPFDAREIIFGG